MAQRACDSSPRGSNEYKGCRPESALEKRPAPPISVGPISVIGCVATQATKRAGTLQVTTFFRSRFEDSATALPSNSLAARRQHRRLSQLSTTAHESKATSAEAPTDCQEIQSEAEAEPRIERLETLAPQEATAANVYSSGVTTRRGDGDG